MCRLFGMSGGIEPVRATFWLLEAPDSLAKQSRREPDGTGLGTFAPDGTPIVSKQPLAAYEDQRFANEAREVSSRTFVAHVRYASIGGLMPENTHPFELHGRLFAHNGVIGGLARLEQELGNAMREVRGETDSERFFALISRKAERSGDVGEGIVGAVRWLAANVPVFALNLVLTTPEELWALRYPETHELYVLERVAGGAGGGGRHLEQASARGSIRVRAGEMVSRPSVVIATERMDEDAGWRPIDPGELLHVGPDLKVSRRERIAGPPAQQLSLADLDLKAASSQAAGPQG
jgi:predicted glutamine amidotransferase